MNQQRKPGLDQFWEQADRVESGQHPLERELGDRVDALARYWRLISDAQANGREETAEILLSQYEHEEQTVQRLRQALAGRAHSD